MQKQHLFFFVGVGVRVLVCVGVAGTALACGMNANTVVRQITIEKRAVRGTDSILGPFMRVASKEGTEKPDLY